MRARVKTLYVKDTGSIFKIGGRDGDEAEGIEVKEEERGADDARDGERVPISRPRGHSIPGASPCSRLIFGVRVLAHPSSLFLRSRPRLLRLSLSTNMAKVAADKAPKVAKKKSQQDLKADAPPKTKKTKQVADAPVPLPVDPSS